MSTILFMNSESNKTRFSHRVVLNLMDLRKGYKYVALSNLSICNT